MVRVVREWTGITKLPFASVILNRTIFFSDGKFKKIKEGMYFMQLMLCKLSIFVFVIRYSLLYRDLMVSNL
jgi:hypothetical protein